MSEDVYVRLPCRTFKNGKWVCPKCYTEIHNHKKREINLLVHDKSENAVIKYRLPYCNTCNIPVVDADLLQEIRNQYGYCVDIALSAKKDHRDLIRLGSETSEKTQMKVTRGGGYQVTEFLQPGRETQRIFFVQKRFYEELTACVKCKNPINVSIFGGYKTAKITTGKWCAQCNNFFMLDTEENKRIIKNYLSPKLFIQTPEITDEGTKQIAKALKDLIWASSKEIPQQTGKATDQNVQKKEEFEKHKQDSQKQISLQDKLKNIPSSIILVVANSSDGDKKTFTIVEKNAYVLENLNRYHYTSLPAREILAAALVPEKNRNFILNGVSYRIIEVVFPNSNQSSLPNHLIPREWYIKRNGGLYSSIIGTNNSIVDVLFYSPFTERYEIVKATYNPKEDQCYTDITVYRSFVRDLGNPQLKLSLLASQGDEEGMYGSLNETSLLKEYGYDVSKKTNLSEKERQDLLAEIVDLEIMQVRDIVNYLDFFVESHRTRSFELARAKWNVDKRYITSYKAKPERFLIAKNYNPKRQ